MSIASAASKNAMHGTANSSNYFNHLPSSKIRSNQARGSVSNPMAIACTECLHRKCSFCEFIPRQAILKCTGKRAARTSCKLPGNCQIRSKANGTSRSAVHNHRAHCKSEQNGFIVRIERTASQNRFGQQARSSGIWSPESQHRCLREAIQSSQRDETIKTANILK